MASPSASPQASVNMKPEDIEGVDLTSRIYVLDKELFDWAGTLSPANMVVADGWLEIPARAFHEFESRMVQTRIPMCFNSSQVVHYVGLGMEGLDAIWDAWLDAGRDPDHRHHHDPILFFIIRYIHFKAKNHDQVMQLDKWPDALEELGASDATIRAIMHMDLEETRVRVSAADMLIHYVKERWNELVSLNGRVRAQKKWLEEERRWMPPQRPEADAYGDFGPQSERSYEPYYDGY